jgi:hypothetical protein
MIVVTKHAHGTRFGGSRAVREECEASGRPATGVGMAPDTGHWATLHSTSSATR